MEWIHAFWLAVVQGITEFLPISSSGHLALMPSIFNWADQGLAFDVAVHVGTLIAVLGYFHKDVSLIARDWFRCITGGPTTGRSKLAWAIVFATVPVGVAAIFMQHLVSTVFRNPVSIAWATIVFALVLGWADRAGAKKRAIGSITWKDVLVIGAAQALALIPGASRSGVTISAGLAMGLSRDAAARFSFLLAIPVIALAGVWQYQGLTAQGHTVQWSILIFGALISAVVAMSCIHFFLRYLQRFSMFPFVLYRVILGVILLIVFM